MRSHRVAREVLCGFRRVAEGRSQFCDESRVYGRILTLVYVSCCSVASNMDSSDEEDLQTALILGLILRRRRRRSAARRKRRMWVRPLLQKRSQQGSHNNLIQEMRLSDRESHFSFMRMSKETFDVLLNKVRCFPTLYNYNNYTLTKLVY